MINIDVSTVAAYGFPQRRENLLQADNRTRQPSGIFLHRARSMAGSPANTIPARGICRAVPVAVLTLPATPLWGASSETNTGDSNV